MNAFIIAVGSYVKPLTTEALGAGQAALGKGRRWTGRHGLSRVPDVVE
jgi:hypothetical protein